MDNQAFCAADIAILREIIEERQAAKWPKRTGEIVQATFELDTGILDALHAFADQEQRPPARLVEVAIMRLVHITNARH